MRILILGGQGFIGSEVGRVLAARGHDVTALVRPSTLGESGLNGIVTVHRDLRSMQSAADWGLLRDFDAVVNCAGALQDSARDDVAAVQHRAMLALYEAAAGAGVKRIVQVSANTHGPGSDTPFLASKQRADVALKNSGLPHVILRPAIVIGRNAHGGSALLRALAAFPGFVPLLHPDTPMQFVALADVADAILEALEGRLGPDADITLASSEILTLRQAVTLHRDWLRLPPARMLPVPSYLGRIAAAVADLLGRLGWRSPLRSTALDIAAGGVIVAPQAGSLLPAPQDLAQILAANPAGVQDRWFARLYLLKPAIIGTLSLFWLLSGLIALAGFRQSSAILEHAIGSTTAALLLTIVTSLADILLGVAVLVRRTAGPAVIGMIVLSLAYLAAASVMVPHLWADPLGPMVKVLPSVLLALAALAILDER